MAENLEKNGANGVIQPLLTDLYQITMAYAYWKSNKSEETAVFDLFFRKNPFRGEFTVFAGLDQCLTFLKKFQFAEDDITYLRQILPANTDEGFYEYLSRLDASEVTVYAIREGTVVFPKVPLLTLKGPLIVIQLLETTLLNLVNYASLVATNAARFRLAAGANVQLLEFGLRRAQGPDGGLSASRYCYMGGFDGTSNVLAGKLYDIPVKGTHAHAFVMSFDERDSTGILNVPLKSDPSQSRNLLEYAKRWLETISSYLDFDPSEVRQGELVAFCAYAVAFPQSFLALVDTYDVLRSGVPNFCAVSLALHEIGYRSIGMRLDSGDLAYLSGCCRKMFSLVAERENLPWFEKLTIVASNDINEETIHSLNQQGHSIDCFGVGTHLVTCQKQPALGCVFKLVELKGEPRIKLSEDVQKVTIPGLKNVYRLYGADGTALVDLLTRSDEVAPQPGKRVLCRHPFQEAKRAHVIPTKVESLLQACWDKGKVNQPTLTLHDLKALTHDCMAQLRIDHKRALNPTPYKVSVSNDLYNFMHDLWLDSAPIGELS